MLNGGFTFSGFGKIYIYTVHIKVGVPRAIGYKIYNVYGHIDEHINEYINYILRTLTRSRIRMMQQRSACILSHTNSIMTSNERLTLDINRLLSFTTKHIRNTRLLNYPLILYGA